MRIYNRAITAAEVKEIFQVPASPRIKAWGPSPADGAKDVTAPLFTWKSVDTIKLHDIYLGTSPDLTAADLVAPRQPLKLYYHAPGLQPGATYYWRVDEIDADMVTVHTGDVWSFMAQPFTAYDPQPADGTNTAPSVIDLRWLKGIGALKHHVYFGDDREAVTQGAAGVDQGIFADPNYSPGDLESAKTYYWRVDEVGAGEVVKTGQVWSFTTVVPVDDFESYTDEEGSRIYETWIDGWTNGTGSTVGYTQAPFAEQTIVHAGLQSMPLDYNNVNAPFISEAEQTFTTAQDWTAGGVDTLLLYVRGRGANSVAPVYVVLKDASNRTGVVVHPDATIAKSLTWTEWKIPLSEFTGVNPARVKTLYIGVGDKANPAKGGTGLIYVDDIGLTTPAPAQ
ncbi:MAG: hypothetical protein A2Y77_15045 [Planctomycetes bacterium RBG_13_62_9]|nr:MAG: hypothetical protein A2Y77_15045 [Planctomycetes bacterium RBG_13_62_9]